MRSFITTHVLDTSTGLPAAGMTARLVQNAADTWTTLATGTTDADGRIRALGPESLRSGLYRIEFDTASYFTTADVDFFFPEVIVTFRILDSAEHYHVPLLLSPFSYSTYRGS